LCIVGQDDRDSGTDTAVDASTTVDYCFSENILFVTGRPVVFVPTWWRVRSGTPGCVKSCWAE